MWTAILERRRVHILPDILCNAGGVTVSYFEWVQNLQQMTWDAERVDRELERIMHRAYDELRATAEEQDVDMRTAAFMLAIGRVSEAMTLRGLR
jgi:glutamate dehydrogenase (NAD(P)+)